MYINETATIITSGHVLHFTRLLSLIFWCWWASKRYIRTINDDTANSRHDLTPAVASPPLRDHWSLCCLMRSVQRNSFSPFITRWKRGSLAWWIISNDTCNMASATAGRHGMKSLLHRAATMKAFQRPILLFILYTIFSMLFDWCN